MTETAVMRPAIKDNKTGEVKWYEVNKSNPCPICGKTGWCMISADGTKAACERMTNDKNEGKINGASIFILDGSKKKIKKIQSYKEQKNFSVLDNVRLNKVYQAILEETFHTVGMRLEDKGYDDLKRRGLSDETISRKKITSLHNIALAQIMQRTPNGKLSWDSDHFRTNFKGWFKMNGMPEYAWKGVPGFYNWVHTEKGKKTESVVFGLPKTKDYGLPGFDLDENHFCPSIEAVKSGDYVVPAVDVDNNIFGMQIRHFDNGDGPKYTWLTSKYNYEGTKALTGVNVAMIPELDRQRDSRAMKQWLHHGKKTVILTEGILKSLVAAEYLPKVYSHDELLSVGSIVLGNGGVAQWKQFLPVLRKLNATNVVLAYDMDRNKNQQVMNYQNMLVQTLVRNDYHVAIASWNPEYKGLDDALQNGERLRFQMIN